MTSYRAFRNTDPPLVTEVWNAALTGRSAIKMSGTLPLEYQVYAKPYFDPNGLILAEDDGKPVGFVHAGFGPNEKQSELNYNTGIVCMIAVIPSYRRKGIGGELLRKAEEYLQGRGAKSIEAGAAPPHNPFYHGLYGGSELPGFLTSDKDAEPFFTSQGYEEISSFGVFQRRLQKSVNVVDPRFAQCRQELEVVLDEARSRATWWQNCVIGAYDPFEIFLVGKENREVYAEALITEMDGFSQTWNVPSVGISDLIVHPDVRRNGLAKFLLIQVLAFLQEQCFELAEMHVDSSNLAGVQLCEKLGFEKTDTGKVYQRKGGAD